MIKFCDLVGFMLSPSGLALLAHKTEVAPSSLQALQRVHHLPHTGHGGRLYLFSGCTFLSFIKWLENVFLLISAGGGHRN